MLNRWCKLLPYFNGGQQSCCSCVFVKPVFQQNPRWVANVRTGNTQHEINMTNAMPTLTIFHLLALGVALGLREFALGVWGLALGVSGFALDPQGFLDTNMLV